MLLANSYVAGIIAPMRKMLFALLLLSTPALADDADLRGKLAGDWLQAVDEVSGVQVMQRLRPDGTATAYFFQDATCKNLMDRINVTWKVSDAVLITVYKENYSDHDTVVAVDGDAVKLHSQERGQDFTLTRAKSCAVKD